MNSPDCPAYLIITDQWREVRHNSKYQAGMGRPPRIYALFNLTGEEIDRGIASALEAKYELGKSIISNAATLRRIAAKKYRVVLIVESKPEEATDAP